MFDIQKYFHTLSLGYILYDFIYCIFVAKNNDLMFQTYLHHFMVFVGNAGGTYIGGPLGSISQLTWLSEGSTLNVNFRQILAWHHQEKESIYLINGLLMAFNFFIFRIIFYTYMFFGMILPFCFDPS